MSETMLSPPIVQTMLSPPTVLGQCQLSAFEDRQKEDKKAKEKFDKDKDKKIKKLKKQIKEQEKKLDKNEKRWDKELVDIEAQAIKAEEERDAVLEEIAKKEAKIAVVPTLSDKDKKKLAASSDIAAYLRKENKKLRKSTAQMRKDNKRLLEANAFARASFGAQNEQLKNNNSNNSVLKKYKEQNSKLKEDLQMRQAFCDAEGKIRVNYQKAIAEIMEMIQDQCDDEKLTEDVLVMALECESQIKN